jgi:hypothetical protein
MRAALRLVKVSSVGAPARPSRLRLLARTLLFALLAALIAVSLRQRRLSVL